MSKTIKILHSCDHIIREKDITKTSKTITRADDKDFDIISSNHVVKSINKVSQGSSFFVIDSDFELFTNNKIRWIGVFKPDAGTSYDVDYEIITNKTVQYDQNSCPRCHGNGWYVGLLNHDDNKLYKSTGLEKMIQDFVKILMTKKKNGLGTNIPNMPGKEINNVDISRSEVIANIRDAEQQYKSLQSKLVSGGSPLPDNEKLYKIEIKNVEFDDISFGFIVELIIHNYEEDRAEVNIMV